MSRDAVVGFVFLTVMMLIAAVAFGAWAAIAYTVFDFLTS